LGEILLKLKAIEESGFSVWIRDSPSLFAYWFILSFHAVGMGMLVGASTIIDLRILGVARDLPLMPLKNLYRIIWSGFWIQVVSGALLLISYPIKSLTNPDFYIKILLIGFAVAVMHTIRNRVFSDSNLTESDMMQRGRRLALIALILWVSAVTAGRLLAYTYTRTNYSG
jgi:hypothetical protein